MSLIWSRLEGDCVLHQAMTRIKFSDETNSFKALRSLVFSLEFYSVLTRYSILTI